MNARVFALALLAALLAAAVSDLLGAEHVLPGALLAFAVALAMFAVWR